MKNFISPNTHLSSFFTGSTVEAMINKSKELDTGYCVCTDNGYLTNIMKGYSKAQKEGLKFIAGCELYFVDKECDIIKGTKAERIKYYTITVHAKTQDAYQFLVKKISEKSRSKINILDQEYPTFNWADLQEFSMKDFTVVLGGPQDIVCKNLLVDETIVGAKIFNKLKNMFGQDLYASIIPIEFDKKWVSSSVFTFTNGQTVTLDSSLMAETNIARTFRISLEEVAEKHGRHTSIKRIYVNGIGYNINKDIVSACNHKDFKSINTDIYKKYNEFMRKLALRFETKMLINDYSYFANEDDKLVQDLKLGDEHRLYAKSHMRSSEDVKEYFCKHYDLEYLNDLVENTYEWAKNFDNFKLEYNYQLVKEYDNYLKATMDLVDKIGRFDKNNPEHVKRLRHELEVIHSNGKIDLLPYFFPISKVLNYYTDQGRIVGPGRGSAGGSFLMYCMGITQIDPLKYGLYFSRFLTLGRILSGSLPDVDVDLPSRDILASKGGFLDINYKDRWAQISTRTIMKLKSSIRDVNRYKYGKVEEEIEKLAKSIEATPQGVSDQDFVFGYEDSEGNHVPGVLEKDLNLLAYTKDRPEEWEIVKRTLGISRQNGRHASAFVITEKPITDIVPTMKISDSENVTQYEAKEVEEAGLIKYDFLVVKCLNDIELALKYINERNDKVLDALGSTNEEPKREAGYFIHKGNYTYIWDLPEEPEVFQMLAEGKTETVFQLNTVSVTPYVQKIKPKSVEDCAVVTSLVRPGPLDFIDEKTGRNMAEEYIERVHGRSKGNIPILDKLIPETHGVMCIAKGSKVKTSDGQVNIEDVKEGSFVQVENGEYKKVLRNIYQGKKQTLRVRLDNSEELVLTPDHKVLTQRGWVEAGTLTQNDLIKHFWVSNKKIENGNDIDWVVGLLLADGQLNQTTYNIAAGKKENALKIKEIIDSTFETDCQIYHHTRCWYVRTTKKNYSKKVSNEERKNPLKEYCKSIGIDGLNCYNKKFPKNITKKMIEGFIEGDGNIKNKRIRICNETMARQIFETLQAMNIKSNLFNDNNVWTVGFNQSTLDYKIKEKIRDKEKDIYVPKENWKLNRKDNRRQHFYAKKMSGKPFIQMSLAKSIAKDYKYKMSNQTWSKVLKIEEDIVRDVYDLSIEDIHSFVVGGNVVHNCFQEQVTKLTKEMTGWDDEKAEDVRIAVGKKKLRMIQELRPEFIKDSVDNGIVDERTATEVWGMIETFGRYGFNKSHAVAYAMIAYACAYLKYYYPLEWWAAVLSNAEEKEITEVLWPYVKTILSPPDINLSNEEMVIDYKTGTIRNKLSVLKGLGEKVANKITEGRPYKDIQDFVDKKTIGHSLARKLIHVGVLDSLFPANMNLMEKMQEFEDAVEIQKYKEKIINKSGGEIEYNQSLEIFIEKAKVNEKTRRCKHNIKKGKIDEKYIFMNPIKDYILKKSIFPTIPIKLNDIIKEKCLNIKIINTSNSSYAINSHNKEVRLIDGRSYQTIKNIEYQPGSDKIISFCMAAYVVECKEFSYKNGERKALKIIVDIDGFLEEFVLWPDYNTGVLSYPTNLNKNSVAILFMNRKMGKENYHTNIEDIIVEDVV